MAEPALADLTTAAAAATEPTFAAAVVPKLGGVDPLGLRQINFDLMDQVIPGLICSSKTRPPTLSLPIPVSLVSKSSALPLRGISPRGGGP